MINLIFVLYYAYLKITNIIFKKAIDEPNLQ